MKRILTTAAAMRNACTALRGSNGDKLITVTHYPGWWRNLIWVSRGKVVRYVITLGPWTFWIGRASAIIIVAAISLLAAPALAQQTTSDAASRSAAYASGGTTIFEGSRGRNNTPDTYAHASSGTTDCQFPGFSFGVGQPGLGLSIGVPLGTDADCKHERMAKFRMQSAEMLKDTNPAEARRNINAANESLCRISYNAATAMCAPAPAPQPVTVYYYCRDPAGYYPAVQGCPRWEMVGPR